MLFYKAVLEVLVIMACAGAVVAVCVLLMVG